MYVEYIYIYIYREREICTHIYIYREREGCTHIEREREIERERDYMYRDAPAARPRHAVAAPLLDVAAAFLYITCYFTVCLYYIV